MPYENERLRLLSTEKKIGVVHTRGKWTIEVTGAAWIFTENDEFFNGNTLEQDPLYNVQAHIVHTFCPGIWSRAIVGYGYGGESTVNGVEKNDRKGNLLWALSLGYSITRRLAVKAAYIVTRTQEKTGLDGDSIAVGFSTFW